MFGLNKMKNLIEKIELEAGENPFESVKLAGFLVGVTIAGIILCVWFLLASIGILSVAICRVPFRLLGL